MAFAFKNVGRARGEGGAFRAALLRCFPLEAIVSLCTREAVTLRIILQKAIATLCFFAIILFSVDFSTGEAPLLGARHTLGVLVSRAVSQVLPLVTQQKVLCTITAGDVLIVVKVCAAHATRVNGSIKAHITRPRAIGHGGVDLGVQGGLTQACGYDQGACLLVHACS